MARGIFFPAPSEGIQTCS